MKDAITYAHDAGFFAFNVIGWKSEFERLIASVRAEYEAPLKQAEEALVYHTQQTRPIYKTDEALVAIREVLADQFRNATKMVAEHKCGGCAKTASDGWALYCVECWEKANGESVDANPPPPNAQVLKPDSDNISGAKQYTVGYFLPQIDESDCDVVHRHRYAGSFGG